MKTLLEGIIEGFVREAPRKERQPGDTWKTKGGWAAKSMDTSIEKPEYGFKDEPSAKAWATGRGPAPDDASGEQPAGGEDDPQAGQQSPDDAIASDPALARIARAGAERGEKPKTAISRLTTTLKQLVKNIYSGTGQSIGTEDSAKGEQSSLTCTQDFLEGTEEYEGFLLPANVSSDDVKKQLRDSLPKNRKGVPRPEDIEKAIESVWMKKEAERYKTPPSQKWLRSAYRTGRSNAELIKSRGYNAEATRSALESGEIPRGIIGSKPNEIATKRFIQELIDGSTGKEKQHYKKMLQALNKAEDTDTTMFYKTDDGRISVVFISNKQGTSDPHGNSTARKRSARLRETAQRNGLDETQQQQMETLLDDVDETITKGGDATGMAKKVLQRMSEQQKQNLYSVAGRAFGDLPADRGRTKDYVDEIAKTGPVKNELVEMYCKKYPKKCKNKSNTKIFQEMEDKFKRNNVGEAFFKSLENNTDDPAPKVFQKVLGKLGDKANGGDDKLLSVMGQRMADTGVRTRDSAKSAHQSIVSTLEEIDGPRESGQPNGAATRAYIEAYMETTHWDQYICPSHKDDCFTQDAVGEFKVVDMGGHKVTPQKYRECLGQLTGFDGDVQSHEGQQALWEHLKNTITVSAGDDHLSFRDGEDIRTVGKEEYRTKGTEAALLTYLGKDMTKCVTSKDSQPQESAPPELRKLIRDITLWKLGKYGN
jgi:hypothetical protein